MWDRVRDSHVNGAAPVRRIHHAHKHLLLFEDGYHVYGQEPLKAGHRLSHILVVFLYRRFLAGREE